MLVLGATEDTSAWHLNRVRVEEQRGQLRARAGNSGTSPLYQAGLDTVVPLSLSVQLHKEKR